MGLVFDINQVPQYPRDVQYELSINDDSSAVFDISTLVCFGELVQWIEFR